MKNPYLSENFLNTLTVIELIQAQYEDTLKPILQHQEHIQSMAKSTLEPYMQYQNYLQSTMSTLQPTLQQLEQIMASTAPALEVAKSYQSMIESFKINISTFDTETRQQISRVSQNIENIIRSNSFPDKLPEDEITNYINKEPQELMDFELTSDMQEFIRQDTIETNSLEITSASTTSGDFKSDLTDKEWHARMWVESIYSLLRNAILLYTFNYIKKPIFETILQAIIDLLSN